MIINHKIKPCVVGRLHGRRRPTWIGERLAEESRRVIGGKNRRGNNDQDGRAGAGAGGGGPTATKSNSFKSKWFGMRATRSKEQQSQSQAADQETY